MRNNIFILLVVILLFLVSLFYTTEGYLKWNITEGFFNWNTVEFVIPLTKPGAINSVHIRYHDQYATGRGDSWINLSDLTLLDKNQNRIPYWNGNVYFESGGNYPGYPVNHLWDDNINTMAHSRVAPDNLIVNLNPPQEISSVQITNRNDCCEYRIRNYRLVFYQNGQEIGSKLLFQLAGRGQTAIYTLISPASQATQGPQGPQGAKGDRGDKGETGAQGPQGIKGNTGNTGSQGPKGDKGNLGPQGIKGDIGPVGNTGPQGPQGVQGNTGPQGIQGLSGIRGDVGSIGLEGVAGGTCSQ